MSRHVGATVVVLLGWLMPVLKSAACCAVTHDAGAVVNAADAVPQFRFMAAMMWPSPPTWPLPPSAHSAVAVESRQNQARLAVAEGLTVKP